MVCVHKCFGERVWFPFQYYELDNGLKSHLCYSKCGLVKNVSRDSPKPVGRYLNKLGSLAKAHSTSNVQIRQISLDFNCLEGP
jgi:hypothetical protein